MRRTFSAAILLVALYWAGLFVSTHVPVALGSPVRHFDKIVHFLAYAGLGAGLVAVLPTAWRRSTTGLVAVLLVAWTYGLADEWIQQFVPGRRADLVDWLADAAGATCGATIAWTAAAFFRAHRRAPAPLS